MLVTTTPQIQNVEIKEYKGVVTGETIVGVNLLRDFFASFRDIFGGRTKSYEKELEKARTIAIEEMVQKAAAWGADAVVAVDVDYESLGKNSSLVMVAVSGTAVVTSNAPQTSPATERQSERSAIEPAPAAAPQ